MRYHESYLKSHIMPKDEKLICHCHPIEDKSSKSEPVKEVDSSSFNFLNPLDWIEAGIDATLNVTSTVIQTGLDATDKVIETALFIDSKKD